MSYCAAPRSIGTAYASGSRTGRTIRTVSACTVRPGRISVLAAHDLQRLLGTARIRLACRSGSRGLWVAVLDQHRAGVTRGHRRCGCCAAGLWNELPRRAAVGGGAVPADRRSAQRSGLIQVNGANSHLKEHASGVAEQGCGHVRATMRKGYIAHAGEWASHPPSALRPPTPP